MRILFILSLSFIFILTACSPNNLISPQTQKNRNSKDKAVNLEKVNFDLEYLSQFPEEYRRLTIPYLRTLGYPGSPITSQQKLSSTSSYSQEVVSYQSEDLQINGLLTRPVGEVPEGGFPAVVFIHGYIPPLSYRTTERYDSYVDFLARNGIVVFKIDLRGHGSSEGEPSGAYYSGDYIIDTLNAYATLEKLEYVNPDKIALWGHSMAGNIVMRSLAVNTNIPLGIIWAGAVYTYTDMQEFRIQDSSYQPSQNPNRGRREELYEAVGDVDSESKFWQMVAPTTYLEDISAQIEIHHAINDSIVNIGYSRNVSELLEQSGNTFHLYEYPTGDHDIESPSFGTAMQRTVEAIKNLKM